MRHCHKSCSHQRFQANRRPHSHNHLKRVTTNPGITSWDRTYTYDANGNRASRTENGSLNETYQYDALNRLTGFNGAGHYGYDDQGRRIREPGKAHLYDGQDVYATYTASWATPASRTLHGPGVDDPLMTQTGAAKSFLHADGQGSVGATIDAAGVLGWYGFYDAWGRTGASGHIAGAVPAQQYTVSDL